MLSPHSAARSALRIDLSSSKLDNPFYTTLDRIAGRVIFAPRSPVVVHDVLIDFLGIATTWLDPRTPATPRQKASFEFLKMNDDQDIREPKTVSQTHPLELPFTFVVPTELLPISCKCPASENINPHLHLPPTMGAWDSSDDLSPDMSKIQYKVRVKVLSLNNGKKTVAAEASERVQILSLYTWWQHQFSGNTSPTYEEMESPAGTGSPVANPKVTRVEKVLKKGLLGKKRGVISIGIEAPDSYDISVGTSETVKTAVSVAIQMRYSPITADLPPKISILSAKLLAHTTYNVDSNQDRRNQGVYSTSVKLIKPLTPSTSAPLWLEDSSSGELAFVSNLLVPISLPPAAGTRSVKGEKVLIPSFESCLISRSYEIEIRIGFDGGSDIMGRVPATILAKPPTCAAGRVLNDAIRSANEWTPPDQDAIARDLEPELLRPSIHNLHLRDIPSRDDDSSPTDSATPQPSTLITQTNQLPGRLPPDYEAQIASRNTKGIMEHFITAKAA